MATTSDTALDPLDYVGVDHLLSDDEKAIRDAVREVVRDRILPEVGDWFDKGILPREVFTEFGQMGFLGAHLEGYGCSGVNAVSYGLINHELEYGDSGLRSAVSVQGSLAMFAIWRWGSEEQKQKYLPRMAAGELIGCFGLTEPDFGSDPGSMVTRAEKVPNGFKLNGAKMWISNAPIADLCIVWAKLEGKIRGFIVERDTKGFSTPKVEGKLSLRTSVTGEVVLADAFVPEDSLLPNVSGLAGPFGCLNMARYGIAWGAMGAAEFCWHAARQ